MAARKRIAPTRDVTGTIAATDGYPTLVASSYSTAYAETTAGQTALSQYLNIGWQHTAWLYYASVGPLNYGVNWLSNAMSRVSLTIAEVSPNNDEPEVLEEGAAVDILHQLKWDESTIMSDLALQLTVPGRGYLVGRETSPGIQEWKVYSPDQIRPAYAGRNWDWELWEYGRQWIPLFDALVAPIRDADDRFDWMDVSTVRGALTVLREIDLYDREIVSCLVSRLANKGILLIPQEVTFPNRQQLNDNQDPFVNQLVEAARQSIKEPGSASAAIPIPLKVPSQFIDKFRHLIVAVGVDKEVLNARDKAISILATSVNLPKEIITGMGDVAHSSGLARDLEESAIKTHICPVAELICRGITRGFLYPQLIAAREPLTGPNGGRLIVWYDYSALSRRPDLSNRAIELYDRSEISGESFRRESGFSEDDAPTSEELRRQLLIKVATVPDLAYAAIDELSGMSQSPESKALEEQEKTANPPAGNGMIPGQKPNEERGEPEPPTGGEIE